MNEAQTIERNASQAQIKQLAPPPPAKDAPPFFYEHVSDEVIRHWSEDDGCSSVVQRGCQLLSEDNVEAVDSLFMELIRSGLDGRLDPTEAGRVVHSIVEQAPSETTLDAAETFLDALSYCPGVDENNPRMSHLCFATQIPAEKMRLILDDNLLIALGIVRPNFRTMFIRKQTNTLYKQSNYNLLREETEGYSKLMTELFTVSQNEEPTSNIVLQTFENMKALIGAFDLDAGRVLDVTMDVAASMLIRNHRFFVKLLRVSDYWPQEPALDGISVEGPEISSLPIWAHPDHIEPELDEEEKQQLSSVKRKRDADFWHSAKSSGLDAFFGLGRRSVLSEEEKLERLEAASQDASDARTQALISWIKNTGTMPPDGNTVAAQLLGFKLRFYGSETRDKTDIMPSSLSYLAAMLIKIGFISLLDLYPHLLPSDDSMDAIKEKGLKERANREQAKRPGAMTNALMRAGPLIDDTLPATSSRPIRSVDDRATTPARNDNRTDASSAKRTDEAAAPEQLPDTPEQKIILLKSLLLIGALPESLFILGRFPWLLDTSPDLPKYIFRILHYCLSEVYESARPKGDSSDLRVTAQVSDGNQSGVPKGGLRVASIPAARVLRWAQMDMNDLEGVDYRFYWDEWTDNIPVCQTVDDVFTLCDTLLNLVGVKIGQDELLLTKLARIGKYSLSIDTSESNSERWRALLKRLLCPALSMTKPNPALVGEVFDLLRLYPTRTRYNIYSEWFGGATSRQVDIKDAFALSRYLTKDIMKKVNKENSLPQARALAKASCSSPGIVFEVFINQLETYDNMIDVVVECGKYFTELSYDVLSWQIISFLGREGRERVSQTGFTANKWLLALSSFTGKILTRYPSMSIRPFLQYVLSQLQRNNYTDLRVLRDVILNMSGVVPLIDLTPDHILALAGGELVRRLALEEIQNKQQNKAEPSKRLLNSLLENQIGASLLIAVSQQRQVCIYNHVQDESKILSEILDEVTTVFKQYLDMLFANLSVEQFNDFTPDVITLISEYGLDVSTAFTIHRRGLTHSITTYDERNKLNGYKPRRTSSGKLLYPNDVNMTDVSANGDIGEKATDSPSPEATAEESAEAVETSDAQVVDVESVPSCHPMLQDVVDRLKSVLGNNFEDSMSVSFYVTFWQLSLADLIPATEIYSSWTKRILDKKNAIGSDRSDVSIAGVKRREEQKKALDGTHQKLMDEMKHELKRFTGVQNRLTQEKDEWFKNFHGKWVALNYSLLQECFFPRLVMSQLDALYAHKILFFLHTKNTPNFRTMHFFDRLFEVQTLTNLIYQCTTNECENFGRFLEEGLKTLNEWHSSRKDYEKHALGSKKDLIGFAKKLKDNGEIEALLDYEEFRTLLYKWHRNLYDALKRCLEDWEYMHVKNAITILKTIAGHFPVVNYMGQQLLDTIQQVVARENPTKGQLAREDLSVLSNSVLSYVKRREKKWIPQQSFYTAKGRTAATPAAINTQTPSKSPLENGRALDAKAQEFTPKSGHRSGGPPMSAVSVEDGEVKDTPMLDVARSNVPAATSKESEATNVNGTSDERGSREQKSDPDPNPGVSSTEKSQEQQAQEENLAVKPQQNGQRRLSGDVASEQERLLKQRAMESIKRKNGADPKPHSRETLKPEEPTSAPPSRPNTRPPSRNLAAEQAPDGPRRDREPPRPSRPSYDSRDPYRQQDAIHQQSAPRAAPDRSSGARYAQEPGRPARQPDMSYGRLNAEHDGPYGQSSRGPPPARPASQAPQSSQAERKHPEGQGAMRPPPRRDYSNPGGRVPHESNRGGDQRSSGLAASPSERPSGMNPERAAMIGQRQNHQQEPRYPRNDTAYSQAPYQNDASYPPEPRRTPNEPPSPKRPRYNNEQGQSIRGRASMPDSNLPPQATPPSQSPRNSQASPDAGGIHPSRLGQVEGTSRPAPIQTSDHRRVPSQSSYPASPANAPSGPRSAGPSSAPSPTAYTGPNSHGPPSGPAGAQTNSYGREGNRRQFAHMQETLNQSGQPRGPNGVPPRGGPQASMDIRGQGNAAPPPPPPRGYHGDPSPPNSRGYDTRGPPPQSSYQNRDMAPPQRSDRGPMRNDMSQPPPPNPRDRDRERERSPVRDTGRRETRERDYSKEYRGDMHERRPERSDRPGPPPRPERGEPREMRERLERPPPAASRPEPREMRDRPERGGGRPDLMGERRDARPDLMGERRDSRPDLMNERRDPRPDLMNERSMRRPRELMPDAPREERGQRLRDVERDRERERSPPRNMGEGRGGMRREDRGDRGGYGRGGGRGRR